MNVSPIAYVNNKIRKVLPTLLVHARGDDQVPYSNALRLKAAMETVICWAGKFIQIPNRYFLRIKNGCRSKVVAQSFKMILVFSSVKLCVLRGFISRYFSKLRLLKLFGHELTSIPTHNKLPEKGHTHA
jgi:hypothetical protein